MTLHLKEILALCLIACMATDAAIASTDVREIADDVISGITPTTSDALYGKKVVTIGDSQTSGGEWQRWLVEWLGVKWSMDETAQGTDGHRPMAVGGTWIRPNNAQSISMRAADAKFYNPDIILIYAGQNDVLSGRVSAGLKDKTPQEQVDNEVAWRGDDVDTQVTTLAAYKGMIERLRDDMPNAHIVLMTHVPVLCKIGMNPTSDFAAWYPSPRFASMDDVTAFEMSERYPKDELIRALGAHYGLPVVDMWHTAGITDENAECYYHAPAGDCTQVHLNALGNELLANAIMHGLLSISRTWNDSTALPSPVEQQPRPSTIVRRMDGRSTGATRIDDLPPGLYIVGNRKVWKR